MYEKTFIGLWLDASAISMQREFRETTLRRNLEQPFSSFGFRWLSILTLKSARNRNLRNWIKWLDQVLLERIGSKYSSINSQLFRSIKLKIKQLYIIFYYQTPNYTVAELILHFLTFFLKVQTVNKKFLLFSCVCSTPELNIIQTFGS